MHRNAVPLRDSFYAPADDEDAGRPAPSPTPGPAPFPAPYSDPASNPFAGALPRQASDPWPDPWPDPSAGLYADRFSPSWRPSLPAPDPEPAPTPAPRKSARTVAAPNQAALPEPDGPHLPAQSPEDRVFAALSALSEIGPRDAMEGMLAAQMVAVHASALDCLRGAAASGLKGRDRHTELRDAARLLGVFERHLKLRDDRCNPRLTRSVAGRSWNRDGARHDDDYYGCGMGWGGQYWVSAQARPARVRDTEEPGR